MLLANLKLLVILFMDMTLNVDCPMALAILLKPQNKFKDTLIHLTTTDDDSFLWFPQTIAPWQAYLRHGH